MSRTDHARPRRVYGHRTSVRQVRLYGGRTADQSRCTCGLAGPLREAWLPANEDGREHLRAIYAQTTAEPTP